jgi:two-component system nitrate/nitrite response regulator NarL
LFLPESPQLSRPVRVLIADDHLLFAEALSTILEPDQRIKVVGRAANGEQAVKLATKLKPDVVLMDISMPVLDGIEAARQIHEQLPEAQVLMLTGSAARQDVAKSRKAGASGYVTKDRIAAELVDTILGLRGK